MYRFMEQEEIEIRQINNLKMIHLYQLGGSDAIAVYYGDNKQINLCAMDKNYNLLMERVLSLYSACDDKNSIIVEEGAKKLIEKALIRPDNHTGFFNRIGRKYMDIEGETAPRFTSDGVMREVLVPMLKFFIKQLYHLWNMDVDFDKGNRGWHRNCVLKLNNGKDTLVLPVRTAFAEDNECIVKVGNFLQDMNTLEFRITYSHDMLVIVYECRELALLGENHIRIDEEGVNSVTSINLNGDIVYYMEESVPAISMDDSEKEKIKFYEEIDILNSKLYKLPWGGHVIFRKVENTDELTKRKDVDAIFVEENNTKVVIRYFSYGLVENLKDGLKLKTDGATMRRLYYGDKHKETETLFMPVGYYSGWDYKKYLENKYFYESAEEKQ